MIGSNVVSAGYPAISSQNSGAPARQGQIEGALQSLGKMIDVLGEVVEKSEGRIQSVLAPRMPEPTRGTGSGSPPAMPPQTAEMADRINSYAGQLEAIIGRLTEMHARVEL